MASRKLLFDFFLQGDGKKLNTKESVDGFRMAGSLGDRSKN